jgi:hypothetical protein
MMKNVFSSLMLVVLLTPMSSASKKLSFSPQLLLKFDPSFLLTYNLITISWTPRALEAWGRGRGVGGGGRPHYL